MQILQWDLILHNTDKITSPCPFLDLSYSALNIKILALILHFFLLSVSYLHVSTFLCFIIIALFPCILLYFASFLSLDNLLWSECQQWKLHHFSTSEYQRGREILKRSHDLCIFIEHSSPSVKCQKITRWWNVCETGCERPCIKTLYSSNPLTNSLCILFLIKVFECF